MPKTLRTKHSSKAESELDTKIREESQREFASVKPVRRTVSSGHSSGAAPFEPAVFYRDAAALYCGDFRDFYADWKAPTIIISDGAYGLASFPTDPPTIAGLADWYRPHIRAWTKYATPETTLWFWNSELGWATVHPLLVEAGWEFRKLP